MREYEQQLPITTSTPHIIIAAPVLLSSEVRVSQFELCSITMDVIFWIHTCWKVAVWIAPTVGTSTLKSSHRVIVIGIH